MIFFNARLSIVSLLGVGLLSACGGGGGSGDGATASTPSSFTQSDVRTVAGLSVTAETLTKDTLTMPLSVSGMLMEGMSLDLGGAGTRTRPPAACTNTSGTVVYTIVKAAAHNGLAIGDQVSAQFNKCDLYGQNAVMDGVVRLTVKSDIKTFSAVNYAVAFQADLTGVSVLAGPTTITYKGVVDTTYSLSSLKSINSVQMSVPPGNGFVTSITGNKPPVDLAYAAGTTYSVDFSTSAGTAAMKLDGNVAIGVAGVVTSLVIATPTSLLASVPSGGTLLATAGALNIRGDGSPTTVVTVNGSTVSVSGDSHRSGSMDIAFDSTWADIVSRGVSVR